MIRVLLTACAVLYGFVAGSKVTGIMGQAQPENDYRRDLMELDGVITSAHSKRYHNNPFAEMFPVREESRRSLEDARKISTFVQRNHRHQYRHHMQTNKRTSRAMLRKLMKIENARIRKNKKSISGIHNREASKETSRLQKTDLSPTTALKFSRAKSPSLQKETNEDQGIRSKKQGIPVVSLPRGVPFINKPHHGKSEGPHFLIKPLRKFFSHGVEHQYLGRPIHRYLSKPIDIKKLDAGNIKKFGSNPCIEGMRFNNIGPCLEGPHIGPVGHTPHVSEIGPLGRPILHGVGRVPIHNGGHFEEIGTYGNNRFKAPIQIGNGGGAGWGGGGGFGGGGAGWGGGGLGGGLQLGSVTGLAPEMDPGPITGMSPEVGPGPVTGVAPELGPGPITAMAPEVGPGPLVGEAPGVGPGPVTGVAPEGGAEMPVVAPGHPLPNNVMIVNSPVHHTERVPMPIPVPVDRPVHHIERFPVPFVINRPVHHTVRVPIPFPIRGPSRIFVVNRPVPMPPKPFPVPVVVPGPPSPPRVTEIHHIHNMMNSPCEVNPCRNGATCSSIGTDFKCVCSIGYKGDRCDVQSKCTPNPCKNFGKCTELPNDYECTCHPGFHGKNCDVESKCEPNPCKNGAVCTETRDRYICSCTPGFMGKNCEQESKCHPVNPCQHNGVCTEELGGYKCGCAENYGGINCEVRLNNNACQSSPCLNGGTCVPDAGDESRFTCNCPPGFSGETCQAYMSRPNPQVCEPNPCLYGGQCLPNGNTFMCVCPDGRNGRNCEVSLKMGCDGCSRHAMCVDDKCVCKPYFHGNGYHCRRRREHCHPNPCENGGTCHEDHHMYKSESGWWCECPRGYSGPICTKYDPCTDYVCHNGGTCQVNGNQPQCTCTPPYSGPTCEWDNVCLPKSGQNRNPCQNGGTCLFINNQVSCNCPPQYEGSDCSRNKCDRCDPNAECHSGTCICRHPWSGDGFSCHRIPTDPPMRMPTPPPNRCNSNPCMNGAPCVEGFNTFFCVCGEDYWGKTCEKRRHYKVIYRDRDNYYSNLCHPNPCLHGGICKEVNTKDFECICANPRYKGRFCDVDMCSECDKHARCVQGRCVCKDGYEGDGYTCTKESKGCDGGCPLYMTCEENICVCQPGTTPCTPTTTGCTTANTGCTPLPSYTGVSKTHVVPDDHAKHVNAMTKGSIHPKNATEWTEDIIVTEYQSLGCWSDTTHWRDPLSRALISLEGMDSQIMDDYHGRKQPISKCAEIARGLGYKFFAIQNGGQCFSGSLDRDYKKYGPSEKCKNGVGGSLANDVYKL